tara:strand:+ start:811 stop:1014 length:204 start_codon:yes stop_codon:yes gene_type:complete
MIDTRNEELPPPANDDVAVDPDHQSTLALVIAGTMEVVGTGDDGRPPILLLYMGDGTVRWVVKPTEE